jgi:hypothetical protein
VHEEHDIANNTLFGPTGLDAPCPYGTDSGHLEQPLGSLLDDVEHRRVEGLDEFAA